MCPYLNKKIFSVGFFSSISVDCNVGYICVYMLIRIEFLSGEHKILNDCDNKRLNNPRITAILEIDINYKKKKKQLKSLENVILPSYVIYI